MSLFHRRILELSVAVCATACGGGGGGAGIASHVTPPSNINYPSNPSLYVVDLEVVPNAPSFEGTVDEFSIDPPLPSGLTLDPATGVVRGTPAETEARTVHTVTAANSGGSTYVALTISVVAPARFAYAISDDSTLSIYSASPITGRLQRKGYVLAGGGEKGPERLVVHPSSRFVYVPNAISSNVSVYAIDPQTGWLTAGAPAAVGLGSHDMVIDRTGRFAYVSGRNSDQVRAFSIHPLTGALTAMGAPIAAGTQPSALALSTSGDLLFVTLRGDATSGAGSALAVFRVDPQAGSLAPGPAPLLLGATKPVGVALDPARHQVFVIAEAAASLVAVSFDAVTGALSARDTLPLSPGPSAVAVHPSGTFAYVAGFEPGTPAGSISIVAIDGATGDLAAVGSLSIGKRPSCITVDASGKFAYVAGHDSSDISAYAIDAHSGALTLVDSLTSRVGPADLEIVQGPHVQHWTPRFVHVTNSGSHDVSAFRIDASSGALTEVGATISTGITPVSLAIDPKQRFVYVANQTSSDIGLYLLSPSTGGLFEANPTTQVIGQPTHVTVDPSGRFLYLTVDSQVAPALGSIVTFAMHPTLGTLSQIDAQPLHSHPTWVTTDPTGQYLYVANSGTGTPGTGTVASFRLPVATGIPVSVESSAAPGVSGLGFHPSGRYIYAMLKHSNAMIQFTIDITNGSLTLFPNVARAGLEPTSVAATPDGRFAYVAFANSLAIGHTALLPIDPVTGFLITPAFPIQDGLHPIDLAVDPSGRFLYVANRGSNDVSVMTIDQVTGELTAQSTDACGLSPSAILVTGVTQ